ncbi:MAG: cupin domain-containing protein [Verrucomicrobia subdivision 3 bacterium]|nr:cupin domain-containing protein [Limisphaerales bacterium]
MINEQQQEQASLYVLGALTPAEEREFEAEVRVNTELWDLVRSLQRTTGLLAMTSPTMSPPSQLREKVLRRIETGTAAITRDAQSSSSTVAGLRFLNADDREGWKQLPVPGAWIKLLSLERERGYAVLLGKLEPGVRYPAHLNVGPEDLYVLTGDLHISGRRLGPGDFHHADAGSRHEVNYSVEGCTLLAVLTADHPLVELAAS